MPFSKSSADVIRLRHAEWQEHQQRWRWLLDSYEGGERYRQATYGYDHRGLPIRNLIRHKREYPDPREGVSLATAFQSTSGQDPAVAAADDDYELRRARTPVPTFVAESVETHLSRVYCREVKRTAGTRLAEWWNDVDGCGTSVDQWMADTIAPLLLVLGQIDLYMDHPTTPAGEVIQTRADVERLGLDRCLASYILPENMLWWRLDATGLHYVECLVQETWETVDRVEVRYRHWTSSQSTLYDSEGEVLAVTDHTFGRVPIVRVFDRRKPRCKNIGQSRYESVAERQREYYNRDSELILSDTTQAHPLLQGPEDYVQPDGTIPIGPGWLLPKKKNTQGMSATYEGFDVVEFPKGSADSIRKNKADIRDDVDRDSALVKPSGRQGVAQSGLSKAIDYSDGNNRLAKLARTLARVERVAAELALCVLYDGKAPAAELQTLDVTYPSDFDLFTAGDVAKATADFQMIAAATGSLPVTECLMLSRLVRLCLPGLGDPQYAVCDAEISAFVTSKAAMANRD